jgi:hypothetical protein
VSVEALYPFETQGACRVCGCDDEQACEGGCRWVAADLCSRCAEGCPLCGAPDCRRLGGPMLCVQRGGPPQDPGPELGL